MDIATIKARMTEFFGKDDMYRMPLGVVMEDWLVAEHDRLTSDLTSAKEEIERTEKLLADQDELRSRYYRHGLKEHPEKAVRDAMIQLEAVESLLSAERKETERLRAHNTAMLLAVRRLKEAEYRYDAAYTGEEFTAAHQETLDAVAAIYAAALQSRQGEE